MFPLIFRQCLLLVATAERLFFFLLRDPDPRSRKDLHPENETDQERERETDRVPEDAMGPSPESRTDLDQGREDVTDRGPGPEDETGPEKGSDPGPEDAGLEKETGITTTEDIIIGNLQKPPLRIESLGTTG